MGESKGSSTKNEGVGHGEGGNVRGFSPRGEQKDSHEVHM